MEFKRKALSILSGFIKITIGIFGRNQASQIAAQLSEDLSPTVCQNTDFGKIQFFCPGVLPAWRAQSLFTKEPETLEWIGTFKETDVLWDIGANIGEYSLYAATKGHSVLAFEPSPSNYYLLSRNIEINRLDNKILAYCMAFCDATGLNTFFMANTELGSALNSFGVALDYQGKPFVAKFKQAMVGFSIDDFIKQFSPSFPNHIKIDVDGVEDKIIIGAKQMLADKRLKSVLVELAPERTEYCQRVTKVFESSGLILAKKDHAPMPKNTTVNHIFIRSN